MVLKIRHVAANRIFKNVEKLKTETLKTVATTNSQEFTRISFPISTLAIAAG
jgi:hypothetical protein